MKIQDFHLRRWALHLHRIWRDLCRRVSCTLYTYAVVCSSTGERRRARTSRTLLTPVRTLSVHHPRWTLSRILLLVSLYFVVRNDTAFLQGLLLDRQRPSLQRNVHHRQGHDTQFGVDG